MQTRISRSMIPWLAALAVACLAVGLMWFFQHTFESKLIAGELDPQSAMDALARLQTALLVLVSIVALSLAFALWRVGVKVLQSQRWPPSGRWPPPRSLEKQDALIMQRRLFFGAIVSSVGAVSALVTALI